MLRVMPFRADLHMPAKLGSAAFHQRLRGLANMRWQFMQFLIRRISGFHYPLNCNKPHMVGIRLSNSYPNKIFSSTLKITRRGAMNWDLKTKTGYSPVGVDLIVGLLLG